TVWLERTATGDVQPEGADAAGAETIDVLRRGLLTGSPIAPQAAAGLRRLAQIPPELLRERLRGSFAPARTAGALAPLGDGDLLRLALLLLRGVPGGSERIRQLPAKGAVRRAGLVQILAGLFAKGRLVPMPEEKMGAPSQDRGRRDLRRRALADLLGDAIGAAVVAWPESLKDEDPVERLLHALPPGERPAALAFARLLTGAQAARVLPPGLAARALAAAAADRLGGAGHTGLALIWRQRLDQGLSSEQRSALRRLLDDALPVSADARGLRRALGLPATPSARQARSEPGLQGEAAAQAEPGSLAWALALLDRGTPKTKRLLRAALRAPRLRERLCKALPDRLLLRFVTVLAPREAFPLVRMALIFAAAHERCGARLSRAEMWAAAIEAAASPDPVTALVRTLIDPKSAAMRGRGPALADRIAAEASALASSRGEPALKAALNDRAYDLRRRSSPSTAPPAEPRRKLWEKAPEPGGRKIHVRNAGLVLAAPFLPQLFDGLGLLGEQGLGSPRPEEALSRGIHLLQYLVDGRLNAPEPVLALNKLLCGADPAEPVLASIEPSADDLATCDSLLEAIAAHWPVMAGSSTAALQELFLQREGALSKTDEGWRLDVERKTIDVLRDAIPWGFSMILLPWMPELLKVDWVTASG
ncbi:MAG TPA: contractile injection system tape measure protein, partial [Allosphingosinicella sp.]